jgi:hypothetical protein
LRSISVVPEFFIRSPKTTSHVPKKQVALGFTDDDPLPFTPPQQHHHISESNLYFENTTTWLGEHKDDPATKV